MVVPTAAVLLALLALSCNQSGASEATRSERHVAPVASKSVAVSEHQEEVVLEALQPLRRGDGAAYRAPTVEELRQFGDWFSAVASAAHAGRLPEEATPDGFRSVILGNGHGWLLAEAEERKRGAGAYLFRPGGSQELIVQAPHTFFDQGTLQLSVALFEELRARALMINTLHRSGSGTKEERQKRALAANAPSDLAHSEDSYYQRAHRVLCQLLPQALTVQLHGYRDEREPEAKFIVSAANTRANPGLVAEALNATLGASVARVYPDEVKVLGGTQNAQARASAVEGCPLIHLEIAASVRERLKTDSAYRRRVAQAIGRGLFEG